MVNKEKLLEFIIHLAKSTTEGGDLYFIGQTTRLMEGWINWIEEIEFAADISEQDRSILESRIQYFRNKHQIRIVEESPTEVIPLPEDYPSRRRQVSMADFPHSGKLRIYHFDPYSVAFRYIAQGDEQDYHLVLDFLQHGWISEETMTVMLDKLLPRFSFQTIQQDPAEFRRRYKGLLQMASRRIENQELRLAKYGNF